MNALIALYWFAVSFVALFAMSTVIGLAFGYPLRQALAGAFWQALIVSAVATALGIAIIFGLFLMGVSA